MVPGIDISNSQSTTPTLTGYEFVFIKATEGGWHDPMFTTHLANVKKAGKIAFPYAYAYGGVTGAAAAGEFLKVIAGQGFKVVAYDVERATSIVTPAQATEFIATCKKAGYYTLLYSSLDKYPDYGQDGNWVAYWNPTPPTIAWKFWQSRGAPLDLDWYNGTLADLQAFAGGNVDYTTITVLPFGGGTATIPAGVSVTGFTLDSNGNVVKGPTWAAAPKDSDFHYDATMTTTATRGNPFIRGIDGLFKGYYVSSSLLKLVPNGDQTPYSQADMDARTLKAQQDQWDADNAGATAKLTVELPPRP